MNAIAIAKLNNAVIEALEGRTLMSAVPLNVTQVALDGSMQLKVIGTAGNDQITVTKTAAGLVVGNTGGWSQTFAGSFKSLWIDAGAGNDSVLIDASVTTDAVVFGGLGNDTLTGGAGNDTLYAGAGNNVLSGGAGNDILVSLGSTKDTLVGGQGKDSFWTDNSTAEKATDMTRDETAGGDLHRVGGFFSGGSTRKVTAAALAKQLSTKTMVEPKVNDSSITYTDFSTNPIFSDAGPAANDVQQGSIGDCYFLAVLSSTAKADAWLLRQSVVSLGDGTFLVQLNKNGTPVYVREDGQLPTWQDGTLAYANLGAQGSTWTALMEKAWCYVRSNSPSYAGIDSGWMDEAFIALGTSPATMYSATDGTALLTAVKKLLDAGKAVTYATNTAPAGSSLLDGHAYSVDAVVLDANGAVKSLRLRNPWGIDGVGNDGNDDGYVTIPAKQAFMAFLGLVSAPV